MGRLFAPIANPALRGTKLISEAASEITVRNITFYKYLLPPMQQIWNAKQLKIKITHEPQIRNPQFRKWLPEMRFCILFVNPYVCGYFCANI